MKRLGITGNISAGLINDFIALKGDVFVENGNLNLITSDFKNKINQADNLGFALKGSSKKNQGFFQGIELKREQNYLGKWYRDGWFSQKGLEQGDVSFSYIDDIYYSRENLPYTNAKSTGLYIDEIWSGYNEKIDSSNYVIGGFVNQYTYATGARSKPFPYKNFNEIFDHSGVQIGDMGGNIAYSKSELFGYEAPTGKVLGYATGERVGYNKIFFLSGLTRDNINNYDYRILLITDRNKFNKRKNINTASDKILGKIEETPDQPRYNVFFYTGNLNVKYTPILTNTPNTLGWGSLYATNITGSLSNINSGFNIACSGTYPQFFIKDFYIYNTGVITQKFYFGKSDAEIIEEISESPNIISNDYKWTNEQNSIFSGKNIDLYSLGKNGVSYFKIKINTKNITGNINSNLITKNETLYIYRATGENLLPNITGLKSQRFEIPVNLNINFNNANVFSDDYLYDFSSGRYTPYILKGNISRFYNSGIINKNNTNFGLTLYATGGILEDPIIKNDLNKKINKLGEYSSTGIFKDIKTIYPLKQGEIYYTASSNTPWLVPLNSPTQIFRWISGFSGFFTGKRFNPISGAIQQDLRFTLNTDLMLPPKSNITGANFTVTYSTGIRFNNSTGTLNLLRGKKYRFLQTNFTNTFPFTINADQVRVFEPEYNKKVLNNYRLTEFNPNLNTLGKVYWTAGTGISGYFNIITTGSNIINYTYRTGISFTGENRKTYEVYNYNAEVYNNVIMDQTPCGGIKRGRALAPCGPYVVSSGLNYNPIKFQEPILPPTLESNVEKCGGPQYQPREYANGRYYCRPGYVIDASTNPPRCACTLWNTNTETSKYTLRKLYLEKNKSYIFQTSWANSGLRNKVELVFFTGNYNINNLPLKAEDVFLAAKTRRYNFANMRRFWPSNPGFYIDMHVFDVPENLNLDKIYFTITGLDNCFNQELNIIENQNLQESTGQYTNITNPIFSGDLNVFSSNVNNKFLIPFVFSGINGIDNINF
jgi:hypothetical protein